MAANHPGQTKVHDLDVAQRRTAGQQDVLWLSGELGMGGRNKFTKRSAYSLLNSPDLLETACLLPSSDLQVQVDHTVLVEEGHSLQDLPHQPFDLLLAESLVL